ncbi:signal peptidase II [Candidatus Enterovibrio escicola]|uniref:Lipoprotein signal peptidase n=1 Tax=Candidatus Enterovibrio escicola TaxID=1927127 RepID=A0A2A5T638_9GAMM|nr:signal peptidase II [Candidatus Enterovibrio escacola]PCS23560.1 Lipoprotein signal peptidase [Candidatus Enterovibrio escacola]
MESLTAKQSGVYWLLLALLVFVLDISSKFWVMNAMAYGEANRIEVLSFFNFLYVHNYGAAFNFLGDADGWQRWFFSTIALSVSVIIVYWMRRTPASNRVLNVAYAMVIGGALGNMRDRLLYGYVVDFLDFYIGSSHWPTFNLADAYICIGASLIMLDSVLTSKKNRKMRSNK